MNHEAAERAIVKELSDPARSRTILLKGPWGCGKTTLWNRICAQTFGGDVLNVSLFGVSGIDEVRRALVRAALRHAADPILIDENLKRSRITGVEAAWSVVKTALKAASEQAGTDVLKEIADPLELVPKRMVIGFDDLDRVASGFDLVAFLGFVSLLTERYSARVMIIADIERYGEWHKEGGETLRVMSERVFSSQIQITGEIATVLDAVIGGYDVDTRGRLDFWRPTILDCFSLAKETNLRTLKKAVDGVENTVMLAEAAIPKDAIRLLVAFEIEKANGRLLSSEQYATALKQSGGRSFGLKQAVERVTGENFFDTFFSGRTFFLHVYDSIYQSVACGYCDPTALNAELFPKDSSDAHSMIRRKLERANSLEWFFNTDQENQLWADDAAMALEQNSDLSAGQVIALFAYASMAARRSSLSPFVAHLDSASRAMERAVQRGSVIDPSLIQFQFASMGVDIQPLLLVYQSERDLSVRRRLEGVMRKALEDRDVEEISDAGRDDRLSVLFESLLSELKGLIPDDPKFVLQVLHLSAEPSARTYFKPAARQNCTALVDHFKKTTPNQSHRSWLDTMYPPPSAAQPLPLVVAAPAPPQPATASDGVDEAGADEAGADEAGVDGVDGADGAVDGVDGVDGVSS